jgi:hypothetical protein
MELYLIEDDNRTNPVPFDKLFDCYADYSMQCGPDTPYICSRGLMKGSCAADPSLWQRSRMCSQFCDTRNKPAYNLYPSFLPVMDRSKRVKCPPNFVGTAPSSMPYLCLDGIASGGFGADPQYWQNSPFCKSYCDTRPGAD